VGVEVANLDSGQLASPDAQKEQAEERETVARVLGDREEPRSRVGRQKRRDALLRTLERSRTLSAPRRDATTHARW
jgi:hypothetical protein